MDDMKKVYDDLMIINLYISTWKLNDKSCDDYYSNINLIWDQRINS